MAELNVPITPGVGAGVDTFNVGTGAVGSGTEAIRQAMVIGSPTVKANVIEPNANGSLPIQGLQSAITTGTIVAATSTITITTANNYNLATIAIWGTYAGVTAIFEASPDGTNWFALQGQRTDTGIVETGPTLLTNTVRAWDVFIGAWTQIRVRATAWTSGTASIGITLQTLPTEPVPSAMLQPAIGGGCSVYSFLSTAAVQAAAIKTSPGQVYGISFRNTSATIAYVRLYNQTAVPATTDTANIRYRDAIPGNTAGAGAVVPITQGIEFPAGIGIRVTASVADNDATALAANVVIGNVFYK